MDAQGNPQLNRNLAALVGSRICHDLISPVGAISNGLELLTLTGAPNGPEMHLLQSSADHANARLRFFRVAFGLSSDGQMMNQADITAILGDVFTGNIAVDWQIQGALGRPLAQAAFLALMCLEVALPHGGQITIGGAPEEITLTARGERLNAEDDHWHILTQHHAPGDLSAARVQFALLPEVLSKLRRNLAVERSAHSVRLQF